jgi:hypothetical protein
MTSQPTLADAPAPAADVPAQPDAGALLEQVVIAGDLARLTPAQRVSYYRSVCESLGLNPLTQPFNYLTLNGRLVLYATRTATDQLRASRGISVQIVSREMLQDAGLYVVTARATSRDGRTDEAVGAVSIAGLRGEALANALMKAETKAKRRATLSLVGLGWLDESEAESVPGARPAVVDRETGEITGEIVEHRERPQPGRRAAAPAPADSPDELTPERWQALATTLRANGLTKPQLLAFLEEELGDEAQGLTASQRVARWFRHNPDADHVVLVAEVQRWVRRNAAELLE